MPTSEVDTSTTHVLVLTGTSGWVEGERYVLNDGDDIVIGRSRSCDISLRRIVGYLNQPPEDRDADHDFNTVSRRHIRVQVTNATVRVEDISTNGTYCNDAILNEPMEIDLTQGAVALRLGTRETFRLELMTREEFEKIAAQDGKAQVPAGDDGEDDEAGQTQEANG